MTITIQAPQTEADLTPRIVVVGVGGAGGNAVNNMIRSNLEGVEFIVANTDAQALKQSQAERKIQLGANVTKGLGAGARPETGREAALETMDETLDHLQGANMVFITAGMGGGTGTGAAPVLAEAAREAGMLTVGVVTKPFHFEGVHRMRAAEKGIEELQQFVDTLIIIPNQNLFRVANEKTTFADAFKMADDVLYSGVRGVTDLMVMPGLINLDFADIRTVMSEMGKAMMGTGEAEGDNRAIVAAESAISNPLLEDVSMKGAQGVLINITGGPDMTLFEVDEAANRIREEVDADANIIFGSTFDESLEGVIRVSVVATGIESEAYIQHPRRPVGVTPLRASEEVETGEDSDIPSEIAAEAETPAEPEAPAIDPAASFAEEPPEPAAATTRDDEPAEAELFPVEGAAPAEGETPAEVPAADAATDPAAERPAATAESAPEPVRPREAFIPPQAARPDDMKRGGDADAFAEAAMANGGGTAEPKAKGKPSLFSRMTGLGIGTREDGGNRPAKPAAPAEPTLLKRPDGRTPQEAAQQAGGETTRADARTGTAEATGNAAEDLAPTRADEEMLEIPAFLRRQAN